LVVYWSWVPTDSLLVFTLDVLVAIEFNSESISMKVQGFRWNNKQHFYGYNNERSN